MDGIQRITEVKEEAGENEEHSEKVFQGIQIETTHGPCPITFKQLTEFIGLCSCVCGRPVSV